LPRILTRGQAPSPEIRFANFDLSPLAGRGKKLSGRLFAQCKPPEPCRDSADGSRCRSDVDQVGIGIAILTLIENTVSVTIRQSDREPIASEATTASISRDEATGRERP
jgi:hypothetical protein